MNYRETDRGEVAVFLVPSLKLKRRDERERSVEEKIHRFLMRRFDGYTAAAGNIYGYWRDESGKVSYGEHKEYKVALTRKGTIKILKEFLSEIAADLGEECIYLETAGKTSVIYPIGKKGNRT
jgi:hypothetical protein